MKKKTLKNRGKKKDLQKKHLAKNTKVKLKNLLRKCKLTQVNFTTTHSG